MAYNLAALRPEEKDQLLTELLTKYENDSVQPAVTGSDGAFGHADEAQDQAMLEPLLQVIEILIGKLEATEERLEKLECTVMDDLIGGINDAYSSGVRKLGIDGIKSKYGHMFDPHMAAIQEIEPEGDLYGTLYDLLEQAKGNEGFDEEGAMTSAADMIKQKLDKIKGIAPEAAAAAEEGAPVSVEKTTVTAAPAEGADAAFLDKIKGMKARNAASKAKTLF